MPRPAPSRRPPEPRAAAALAAGARAAGALAAAVLAAGALAASPAGRGANPADYNLDFERPSAIAPERPAAWNVASLGHVVVSDRAAYRGARSLRVESSGAPGAPPATVASAVILPAEPLAGRVVRVRGHVRTRDVRGGRAALWIRAQPTFAVGGPTTSAESGDACPTGTADWTPCEVALRVGAAGGEVVFGVRLTGAGAAWFDALSVDVDGVPYAPPARSGREMAWLRRAAVPLAGDEPSAGAPRPRARPSDDEAIARAVVGGARVVALGESTHGTSEFARLRHRVIEHMARAPGPLLVAVEAGMAEARVVDEYVRTGRGDLAAALRRLNLLTMATREVADLVEWMRAHAAAGGHVELWGFDSQSPTLAMDSVRAFVARADPAERAAVDAAYGRVTAVWHALNAGRATADDFRAWRDAAGAVLARLESRRAAYEAAGRDTAEVAWAVQHARMVAQGAAARLGGVPARDSSMAANVAWMLARRPEARAVLWAHNAHVSRLPGWMGDHLARRYGADYRPVALALGTGAYAAYGPVGRADYEAVPPPPGSVESALAALGLPRLALDLRAAARSPDGAWLLRQHDLRAVGALVEERGFWPSAVARDFDAIVYVDRTTPTRALPPAARAPAP